MINYKKLGNNLRKARVIKGYTQEKLAEKADLSLSHISNIETANTRVSLPTLVDLANILDITIDELLVDSYENRSSIDDIKIKYILSDCTDEQKEILFRAILGLKQILLDANLK